jgi:predicted nuclease with TOPRIM domain
MALQSHPELKHHVEHLDFMLHETQKELDNSRHYANQTHAHMAQQTDTIRILAHERKTLRRQRAKKDYTIARLRAKIVSLEATVKAQEEHLKDLEGEGEDIQGGNAFLSDDDDYEEDEDLDFHTDVEGYEFMETGEDGFIPIDVDDEE